MSAAPRAAAWFLLRATLVALRTLMMMGIGGALIVNAVGCGGSSTSVHRASGSAGETTAGTGGAGAGHGGAGGTAEDGMSTGGMSSGGAPTAGSAPTGGMSPGGSATGGMSTGGMAAIAGAAGANACGERGGIGPNLSVTTLDPSGVLGSAIYDGTAVVERSADGAVMLSLGASNDGAAGAGGADTAGAAGPGGGGAAVHATLSGVPDNVVLEPGTKLWLTLRPKTQPFAFGPSGPWSLSIRDHEDGTLLFGSSFNDFTSAAAPVAIGTTTTTCTSPTSDICTPNGTITYSSVEVLGDEPVVIEDSTPGAITLGGVPYDVRLGAQSTSSMGASPCVDYYPVGGIGLDIRATHLDELVATLDVGSPPACAPGNEPSVGLYFGLNEVDVNTTYEGVVKYLGPDPNVEGAYSFDVPGLASLTGMPPTLSIMGAVGLMPEPAKGQQFWLSFPSLRAQALRESATGAVLLAQGRTYSDSDVPNFTAELGNLLGVPITIEDACEYAPDTPLQDTVFGTTPEVRVASGTSDTLVIDGQARRVWAWGQGYNAVTIYPAD